MKYSTLMAKSPLPRPWWTCWEATLSQTPYCRKHLTRTSSHWSQRRSQLSTDCWRCSSTTTPSVVSISTCFYSASSLALWTLSSTLRTWALQAEQVWHKSWGVLRWQPQQLIHQSPRAAWTGLSRLSQNTQKPKVGDEDNNMVLGNDDDNDNIADQPLKKV